MLLSSPTILKTFDAISHDEVDLQSEEGWKLDFAPIMNPRRGIQPRTLSVNIRQNLDRDKIMWEDRYKETGPKSQKRLSKMLNWKLTEDFMSALKDLDSRKPNFLRGTARTADVRTEDVQKKEFYDELLLVLDKISGSVETLKCVFISLSF